MANLLNEYSVYSKIINYFAHFNTLLVDFSVGLSLDF